MNSAKVRLPRLLDWLDQRRLDVVTLQETELPDAEIASAAPADADLTARLRRRRGWRLGGCGRG